MALQQFKPRSPAADDRVPREDRQRVLRKIITTLGESDLRLLYGLLVSASVKESPEKTRLLGRMTPPSHISRNLRKLRTWTEASEWLASLVSIEGRSALWQLYEELLTEKRAKLLGQYFTPPHVARLALSGLANSPATLLDPMAGHGVFLKEARERFSSARLTAVEIDSLPISAARLVLDETVVLTCADVFEWAAESVKKTSRFQFEAIVGNPAYVGYQNIGEIKSFVKGTGNGEKENGQRLLEILKELAESKGLSTELATLFHSWSGLSDLSMYTLILAWLLVDPNGQIAFVMSNHWMERDYGRALRQFLSSHGTVRGIVTHRAGNWFPRAQIPASIFVYTKGQVSDRQNSKGIPYVEIVAPYVEDIGDYLRSVLKEEFWLWLDSITKPGTYGSLRVSFRQWMNHEDERLSGTLAEPNLILPQGFNPEDFISLEEAGWNVHQGLRTGCNEFFYVKKDGKSDSMWIARRTVGGEKEEAQLEIPTTLLTPTIRKLSGASPLSIGKKDADVWLLTLDKSITEEDKQALQRYPKDWLKAWHIEDRNVLADHLARHIHSWGRTPYEGKGSIRGPVSSLSAVRTNVYTPPLNKSNKIPRPPRFWYQVSIQPRHFAKIILPRVSSGVSRAFLIKDSETLLIDANFSTFNSGPNAISSKRMWIWLNSNTFRALCELNGVPLGGGALKLEAALLSRLPIPKSIVAHDAALFVRIGHLLEQPEVDDKRLLDIGSTIDTELFGQEIARRNLSTVEQLMGQRRNRA